MDTITPPAVATLTPIDAIDQLTGPGNIGSFEDRTITHSIDLHTVGDTLTQLQLTLSHDKESRRFNARLTVVGVIDRGGYTVTVSTPFVRTRSRRLPYRDVSRYSAKALMAFRSEIAQMLRSDPSWLDLDLSPWPGTPDPAAGGISAVANF